MKIVFVHGRSQQRKVSSELEKEWKDALLAGFTRIGIPYAGTLDFTLPYYGDVLFDAVEKASLGKVNGLMSHGAPVSEPDRQEQAFVWQVTREMAMQNGITDEQIAQEAGGNTRTMELHNWPLIQAVLRLLDKIEGASAAIIELFLRDTWYYLTKKDIRQKVNEIVDRQLPRKDECIVVAHSLGSVVAYNLLMDRQPARNVKAFITLGSPLGFKDIYDRLPSDASPRKAPPAVGQWHNLRDKRDTVALHEIGKGVFAGVPTVLNNSKVINESDNRHDIANYLHDPEVAALIRQFLP